MHRPDSQRSRRMTNKKDKKSTSKIIARLTYIPKKHKQKVTRKLRQKLQEKPLPDQPLQTPPPETLLFGSFNINGLSLETSWSVTQLLQKRGYDVSKNIHNQQYNHYIHIRF